MGKIKPGRRGPWTWAGAALIGLVGVAWVQAAHRPPRSGASATATAEQSVALFQRFALNALLVPMLEPEGPVVWSDPSLTLDCALGTRVSVDGRRLQPGEPLPARPFRVHWHLVGCLPFGGELPVLDGDVELQIAPVPGGLRATVLPRGLQVFDGRHSHLLAAPFEARLALDNALAGP